MGERGLGMAARYMAGGMVVGRVHYGMACPCSDPMPCYALICTTPDHLVSGSYDQTIRVWDLKTGRTLATADVQAPVNCLCSLPDGVPFCPPLHVT